MAVTDLVALLREKQQRLHLTDAAMAAALRVSTGTWKMTKAGFKEPRWSVCCGIMAERRLASLRKDALAYMAAYAVQAEERGGSGAA